MALLKFLKGNYSSLSSAAIAEGQVLICGDTGEMFVDVAADKRVKIGDYVTVASLDALRAIDATAVPTSRLYYVEGANILARSNGTTWDQINKDTGATSIEVVGEGNAVTAASYDAVTRKLTLTKGATFATKAELDTLDTFVGDIPEGYTETNVIAYINKKAEETLNAASGGSSESAASVLAALNSYKAENDPKVQANTEAAAAAQKAADDAQGDVDTLAETHATDKATLEAAIALKANAADVYNKGDIDGKVDTINQAIAAKANAADVYTKDDIDGMVDDLEAADLAINNLIGDVPADSTVMAEIAKAQSAATYDDSVVRGLIDTNAQAIAQEKTDREGAVADLQDAIDAKADQTALDAEVQRATGVEGGFETRIKAIEDDYLKAADKTELQDNIDTLTGVVETLRDGIDADKVDGVIDLINYVEEHGAEVTGMKEDIDENAQAIVDEAARAAEAEEALGGRIDTLSGVVDTKAAAADLTTLAERVTAEEGKVVTLQTEMDAVEQKAADNAAAIEALQGAAADYALDADLDTAVERIAANETAIGALQTASATHATQDALNALETKHNEYETAHADDYTNAQIDAAIDADVKVVSDALDTHKADAVAHITADERESWNGVVSDLATHKAAYDAKIAELVAEDADIRVDFAAADAALQSGVDANTAAIAKINGDANTDGSFAKADAAVLTDAKAYSDEKLLEALTWGEF